ncbi:MAG: hypothetical protein ACXW3C_03220 [Pyrinomonadaceae bacterium]
MGFVSNGAKKILFWNYPRTSWQWDVLCVLILVFIFLTPKSWFANTSYQDQTARLTVVIGAEVLGAQADRANIERRAREAARLPDGQVVDVRPQVDASGKITGYEVDIR